MKLKGNWKACIQKRGLAGVHTPSLYAPPKPLPVPTLLPNPRSSNSTLPFRCPEGEDMSQHQTWKCELPLSPQNVIISENLGHRATEKVTLPTFFCSVARHLLPLSESSFSWGWTLTLKKKIWEGVARDQQGQPPPKCNWLNSFCRELQQFTALNIWCLAVFMFVFSLELKKEKEKNSQSHSWS